MEGSIRNSKVKAMDLHPYELLVAERKKKDIRNSGVQIRSLRNIVLPHSS